MKPKIKETHDYITISFINGNFTCSRRGYRASGSITDKAFNNLSDYFEDKESDKTLIEKVNALFEDNNKIINELYPGWDKELLVDFKVGEEVILMYKKKEYLATIIEIKKGGQITIKCPTLSSNFLKIPGDMLKKKSL